MSDLHARVFNAITRAADDRDRFLALSDREHITAAVLAELGGHREEPTTWVTTAPTTHPAEDRRALRDRIAAATETKIRQHPMPPTNPWDPPGTAAFWGRSFTDLADAVMEAVDAEIERQRGTFLQTVADALHTDMEQFFAEYPKEPHNSPYVLGRKDAERLVREMSEEHRGEVA
ncbi:hypothetical protein AB0I72_19305 [Nocardiopsis sp. NPDC049922]|uniref:hypothetical protein n=1 Tax=Nocardiopsis sp. NPDC049922 TaxID=3155157 RepID=UPI0033F9EA52